MTASTSPPVSASPSLPPHAGEGEGPTTPRARAHALRRKLTPSEARLWAELKTWRGSGAHFRRQAPFRGYILDFVCFTNRLVVEADGPGHAQAEQAAHDATRDAVLAREGFRTLRFWNHEVRDDWDAVRDTIGRALTSPSRSSGGTAGEAGQGGSVAADTALPGAPRRSSRTSPPVSASPSHPPHEGEGEE